MVMTVEEKRERRRLYAIKYRAKNKEKLRKYDNAYRLEWNKNNVEKLRKVQKENYERNKTKIIARAKAYYSKNKDKLSEYHAKYHKDNLVTKKKNSKLWRKNNLPVILASNARYRAKKFSATIYMTKEDKVKIDELYVIASDATRLFGYNWAVDHIVPLNKGGLHKLSNLQVVPASWNSAKGDRNSDVYWG